mmetsp:Transcript_30775/g.75025  ORF Transcript_30775/g.75025 Transcript_30775/m.75025 type:complete len:683 (-) Transcript_30775:116-2164(-)
MLDKDFEPALQEYLRDQLPKIVDSKKISVDNLTTYTVAILQEKLALRKLKPKLIDKLDEFLGEDSKPFADDLFGFIEKNAPKMEDPVERKKRKRSAERETKERRRRHSPPPRDHRDSRRDRDMRERGHPDNRDHARRKRARSRQEDLRGRGDERGGRHSRDVRGARGARPYRDNGRGRDDRDRMPRKQERRFQVSKRDPGERLGDGEGSPSERRTEEEEYDPERPDGNFPQRRPPGREWAPDGFRRRGMPPHDMDRGGMRGRPPPYGRFLPGDVRYGMDRPRFDIRRMPRGPGPAPGGMPPRPFPPRGPPGMGNPHPMHQPPFRDGRPGQFPNPNAIARHPRPGPGGNRKFPGQHVIIRRNMRANGGRMRREPPPNPTNLYVENVPPAINNIKSLSSHFEQFGEIVNVQVHADKGKAYVQFRTHEQASRALRSPKAVRGNRFIKVKWAFHDPQRTSKTEEKSNGEEDEKARIEALEKECRKEQLLHQIQVKQLQKRMEVKKRLIKLMMKKGLKPEMKTQLKAQYETISHEIEEAMEKSKEQEEKIAKLKKSLEENSEIKSESRSSTATLVVEQLPLELREEDLLKEHFGKFGDVLSVDLSNEDTAIIKYEESSSAADALENGTNIGEHTLVLKIEEQLGSVLHSVLESSEIPEVENVELEDGPDGDQDSEDSDEVDEDAGRD